MKKIIRLTESDLIRLVKRVINENNTPSVMAQIYRDMKNDAECSSIVIKLRNVVAILVSGNDYATYSKTGTWGGFLDLLNKLNTTLKGEMARRTNTTNPMFTKIQSLCVAQGIKPKDNCVVKFQRLILSKAKGENELETESGKIEWTDGIVGLATLQSLVLGLIDFFQSVLNSNPSLKDSPLVTQITRNPNKYDGVKDVEQNVGTRQR